MWKEVNNLLSKNEKSSILELTLDETPCAGTILDETFNAHFLVFGVANNNATSSSNYKSNIASNIESSIFSFPTTESEISLLLELRNSSA